MELRPRIRPGIWLVAGVVTALLLIGGSAGMLGSHVLGNDDWGRDEAPRGGSVLLAPDQPPVRPERSDDAVRRAERESGGTLAAGARPQRRPSRPSRPEQRPARASPVRADAIDPPAPSVVRTLPGDADADGLSDDLEQRIGTDPRAADSDGDALPDAWEEQYGLDPTSPADADVDEDADGLLNRAEYRVSSNPRALDTNQDGRPDGEDDADGDALPNEVEQTLPGTDPANADTNGDGVPDGGDDPDGDGVANADETVTEEEAVVSPDAPPAP